MRRLQSPLIAVGCLWLVATAAAAQNRRPIHTYSIVARDPASGQMGVAVQTHWFAVGSLVPWGEAGVGVVATQSFVDPSYGPLGLELMRSGKSARQALDGLTGADPHPEVRQVAMLDNRGGVAAHTGERCIPMAGHEVGDDFSVQANLMLSDAVWPKMAAAFRSAEGDLAHRMLAALEAAESVGGDIRGRQSAAILVVRGESTGQPWNDRLVDLRVEDHPEPLAELRRLLKLRRAYDHMNRGDVAIEENDPERALREYGAAEALVPDNPEMKFWHAVSLVNLGRVDESLPLFRQVFAGDANWARLLPRLTGAGLLQTDEATVERILALRSP